jgi:O-antigen/teichoic acid export membrane protein
MCHKIGGTVLNSTDNIILSSFVGLVAVGIYSNYSLILSGINGILKQVLGSFTATLGNAHVEQSLEDRYVSYRRLIFANMWIASVCTICMFVLIDDFIYTWLGKDMLLDTMTVVVLCVQFYLTTVRFISTSFIDGCGLFVRDKIRPLIEAFINVVVSIVFVRLIGIAGVFVGTIISHLCTVFWREPYLLFKYEFKRSSKEYWGYFVKFSIVAIAISEFWVYITNNILIVDGSMLIWIIKSVFVFVISNIILIILFVRNKDLRFYFEIIMRRIGNKG